MKLNKYLLYVSTLAFCGCVEADPKANEARLTCPYILPAEKDFPKDWITVKKIPLGRFQLRETVIALGSAPDLKSRLTSSDTDFDTDIIDYWLDKKDRSEATAEYPEGHREMSMMCTYSKNQKEYIDPNLNVVLLIPLPSKKPVSCLLTRRDVDPTHEMSCKVN